MPNIDMTLLKYEDYLILKDWCERTELIYDDGSKGSPMDYLFLYDEPYEGEAAVWNTPEAFDRWLYVNCPLPFIQKRLREQYLDQFKNYSSLILGTRYKIIKKPQINFRNKHWFISSEDWRFMWEIYNNKWRDTKALLKPTTICSCAPVKNLTKRKLNRLIRNWKLPVGTIMTVYNNFIGSSYKIEIIN